MILIETEIMLSIIALCSMHVNESHYLDATNRLKVNVFK